MVVVLVVFLRRVGRHSLETAKLLLVFDCCQKAREMARDWVQALAAVPIP